MTSESVFSFKWVTMCAGVPMLSSPLVTSTKNVPSLSSDNFLFVLHIYHGCHSQLFNSQDAVLSNGSDRARASSSSTLSKEIHIHFQPPSYIYIPTRKQNDLSYLLVQQRELSSHYESATCNAKNKWTKLRKQLLIFLTLDKWFYWIRGWINPTNSVPSSTWFSTK